jgi:RNA polymerase sigma-70 factor (ECF subfamily)
MKAFDEIYNEYANVVFKYLMSLTMDPDLSEELTQETFYKAFRSIDEFDGKYKMSTWLCQIAKNCYFSYYRKEKRKHNLVSDEQAASTINIEDDLLKAHDTISLHRIIRTLEEPYKEVFYLRFFGELSYQQISEILGKSESWARVIFYRAKEKIRTIFNKDGKE